MKINKNDIIDIVENAMSWVVVLGMLVYGAGKLVQFDGAASIQKSVSELTGMELMWAFYGYSFTFAVLLGILELLGATLIFFKKTRLIGCLFTSTILINIIIQDIVFEVHVGALRAALFYQTMIVIILILNKEQLVAAIRELLYQQRKASSFKKQGLKLGLGMLLFVLLRLAEMYLTRF